MVSSKQRDALVDEAMAQAERSIAMEKIIAAAPQAVDVLTEIMDKSDAEDADRIRAAKSILEYAEGRPGTQAPINQDRGLTIQILNFSGDERTPEIRVNPDGDDPPSA